MNKRKFLSLCGKFICRGVYPGTGHRFFVKIDRGYVGSSSRTGVQRKTSCIEAQIKYRLSFTQQADPAAVIPLIEKETSLMAGSKIDRKTQALFADRRFAGKGVFTKKLFETDLFRPFDLWSGPDTDSTAGIQASEGRQKERCEE